ncbi:MAG: leucyl aminopeptidase [Chloroflexota bacterium]|nr:leucyl aminopeptidase [Chloroflexota bacterium]
MDLRVQQGSVTEIDTPLLVVNLFEGVAEPGGATGAVDAALGGQIRRLIADGEITGESATITVIHNAANAGEAGLKARRVAVVGLGPPNEFQAEQARIAAAVAARKARDLNLDSFATIVHGAGIGGLDVEDAARATMESSVLALYRYEQFKEATRSKHQVSRISIVERDADRARRFRELAEVATLTCEAVNHARDLSVGPGNYVTPTFLAEQARQVAQRHGLEVTVWGKDELRERGMNAILAVNAGSSQPPAFVVLRYVAPTATRTVAVVGKGITFDSGGISIKSADQMEYMRHDMTGAAIVIAFAELAAATKLPVNVLGVFAATENLPSGTAYKPGDVFKAYNGKTMEIVNTDAEGRVILSDSLAYAAEQRPDAIVDFATLTGACQVALGDHATGLMSNDQRLADMLLAAGEKSGDRCWQLPLWKVYGEQIKTAMADVRNSGGRRAGAITAGLFLKEFVGDIPWAHLDIAGTAYADGDQTYVAPYNPRPGPTGVGVRLLWHFCQAWVKDGS